MKIPAWQQRIIDTMMTKKDLRIYFPRHSGKTPATKQKLGAEDEKKEPTIQSNM